MHVNTSWLHMELLALYAWCHGTLHWQVVNTTWWQTAGNNFWGGTVVCAWCTSLLNVPQKPRALLPWGLEVLEGRLWEDKSRQEGTRVLARLAPWRACPMRDEVSLGNTVLLHWTAECIMDVQMLPTAALKHPWTSSLSSAIICLLGFKLLCIFVLLLLFKILSQFARTMCEISNQIKGISPVLDLLKVSYELNKNRSKKLELSGRFPLWALWNLFWKDPMMLRSSMNSQLVKLHFIFKSTYRISLSVHCPSQALSLLSVSLFYALHLNLFLFCSNPITSHSKKKKEKRIEYLCETVSYHSTFTFLLSA